MQNNRVRQIVFGSGRGCLIVISEQGKKNVVLPSAVNFKVLSGNAFTREAAFFQNTGRRFVVEQASSFNPVETKLVKAKITHGADCFSHITLIGKRLANPVAQLRRLGDATPDIGNCQAANQFSRFISFKNKQRIRFIFANVAAIVL